MLALSLALALQSNPAPPPPWYGTAGRFVTTPQLHAGFRPAFYADSGEVAVGFTLQLSTQLF
jgi:hypothetical protein